MTEIKDRFKVTSPQILPRIKELMECHLIYKNGDRYSLTAEGVAATLSLQYLMDTLRVIEDHREFWAEHKMDTIPPRFLMRIGELGACRLIRNNSGDIGEAHRAILDDICKSKSVKWITPIYHSYYYELFQRVARQKMPISLILTESIFNTLGKEYDGDRFQRLFQYDNAYIYKIHDDVKISIIVTDTLISLSIAYSNSDFDFSKNLISYDKSAIKWGEELFDYYKERSKHIKAP